MALFSVLLVPIVQLLSPRILSAGASQQDQKVTSTLSGETEASVYFKEPIGHSVMCVDC